MRSSAFTVSDADRVILESWTRSSTVLAGRAERARIVLAVADGAGTSGAARQLGVSRPTVIKWRDRFAVHGVAGLDDEPRSGRPKRIDEAAVVAATLEPPPDSLGVTHWSSRLLGKHLGVGDATVARAWRKYRVQPWRRETFKFSTDPEMEAKVRDVRQLQAHAHVGVRDKHWRTRSDSIRYPVASARARFRGRDTRGEPLASLEAQIRGHAITDRLDHRSRDGC